MSDEAPRAGRSTSYLRLGLAIAVPVLLALLAAGFPQLTDHSILRAALALAAGAIPASMLIGLIVRTRVLEESIRQLARGDLARALPMVDDEALAGMLAELDAMRRMLQGQLRDMAVSSDEQERSLSVARRTLLELAGGVQKQVAAVEETAASLHADDRLAQGDRRTSWRRWPRRPRSRPRRSSR